MYNLIVHYSNDDAEDVYGISSDAPGRNARDVSTRNFHPSQQLLLMLLIKLNLCCGWGSNKFIYSLTAAPRFSTICGICLYTHPRRTAIDRYGSQESRGPLDDIPMMNHSASISRTSVIAIPVRSRIIWPPEFDISKKRIRNPPSFSLFCDCGIPQECAPS